MACKVALARCALDPLAVLASLCGPSGEILGAILHPLQDVLPKQEVLAVAERLCITATNQVSVGPLRRQGQDMPKDASSATGAPWLACSPVCHTSSSLG